MRNERQGRADRAARSEPADRALPVLRGEIGESGVRPIDVPTSIAKMSVAAISKIAATTSSAPTRGKVRSARKYEPSQPM